MTNNIFDTPEYYRKIILQNNLLSFEKKQFNAKSLICVFLTRFCNVGCPFCFFKSAPAWRAQHIEDQLSDEGLDKFINFANQANLGYLLVSGGGEPLNKRKHILEIANRVESDKIVLVTSGNWAIHFSTAEKYVAELFDTVKSRCTPTTLVIRVSVSEGHAIKLGIAPILNLIKIFEQQYKYEEGFLLQIKSFENDSILDQVLQNLPQAKLSSNYNNYTSDSNLLIKTIFKTFYLTFPNGYSIKIGMSKIFQSGLRPDLHAPDRLQEALEVFDHDLKKAQCHKPGIVFNTNREEGLDWAIGYNGNISIWQGQIRDNDMNIYHDSFADTLRMNLEDPIIYSFLDKGSLYRENIISEVNPRTILRARAIGLRDCLGAIIFEDKRDRLYYAIRVLQDYIKDAQISLAMIKDWPQEISQLVNLNQKDLINLYKNSTYNIVEQQKRLIFNQENWYDFLELIKLGHYNLQGSEIQEAVNYYNMRFKQKLSSVIEIIPQTGMVETRLTEKLTYMKKTKIYETLSATTLPKSIAGRLVENNSIAT